MNFELPTDFNLKHNLFPTVLDFALTAADLVLFKVLTVKIKSKNKIWNPERDFFSYFLIILIVRRVLWKCSFSQDCPFSAVML